jgi:hypothetical protein
MRTLWALSASVGIAGIVLLGGCTSSGSGGSAGANAAGGGALHAPAEVPKPAQQHDFASDSGGSAGSDSRTGASTTALIESRALIRTAELRVAVKSGTVGEQAGRADEIALGAGGEVFSDNRSTGKAASASLTLKVPPDALADVLNRLAALGTEQSRSMSTQDVTQQVADVSSRVQSARDSIARLRALYDHAVKVSDVIAIEGELAGRESDLESLEAQQRSLDAQTSMATVHLELTTATPPAATPHKSSHEHGVGGAFVTGWRHFAAAAAWVARAVATALPFLVVLALFAGCGLLFWRRRPTPTPPPAPDAG